MVDHKVAPWFVLLFWFVFVWCLIFWENEKEPTKTLSFRCFCTFWGRMFQINSRTETKQKTFSKIPPLFGGVSCLFLFLVLLYFFLSLLPVFLYLSSFCFKEKDTESNITPKNKRGKTTLKKTTNKENTKTMNNEEQQQTKKRKHTNK